MSRYLILLILCSPFVLLGVTSAVVNYKLGKTTRRRFFSQILLWLIIFVGLTLAHPLYEYLFSNDLTVSEPLSLFDVVALVAVVTLLYIVIRIRTNLEAVQERTRQLHEELSIYTSTHKK